MTRANDDNIPDVKISPDQQRVTDQFLLSAVAEYNNDRILLCLRKGADINCRDGDGTTPLMKAVSLAHLSMVKLLLAQKPDMFRKDRWDRTAFDLAKNISDYNSRNQIIDALLSALPDHIRHPGEGTEDALRRAAEELTQQKGPDLATPAGQQKPKKGFTP